MASAMQSLVDSSEVACDYGEECLVLSAVAAAGGAAGETTTHEK